MTAACARDCGLTLFLDGHRTAVKAQIQPDKNTAPVAGTDRGPEGNFVVTRYRPPDPAPHLRAAARRPREST